jgi:alanine racemase
VDHGLTACVYNAATARAYAAVAQQQKKPIRVHVKVDTGMGRLGMLSDSLRCAAADSSSNAVADVLAIAGLAGIEIEGIFSHFACADSHDKASALCQLSLFADLLKQLDRNGLRIPVRHMANSAATIEIPESHLDMVRPGIAVYGLNPSNGEKQAGVPLQPAMAIKTCIVHLKRVSAGFAVSYGSTFVTEKSTTIATVPIGYGDGYSRRLSSAGSMLVRGHRAPVVGRVCMDLTMIDVGHISGADVGDEVVALGTQGDETISAEEIALAAGTINYEVVTAVSARVPRVFRAVPKTNARGQDNDAPY